MPATAKAYGKAAKHTSGDSFLANDIRVMLLTGYAPDQDAHEFLSDVVATEIASPGYVANGQALTGKVVNYTAGANALELAVVAAVWPASVISATHAVIYDRTPATDATRPLIAYVDFGGAAGTLSVGTFKITWDPAGLDFINAYAITTVTAA